MRQIKFRIWHKKENRWLDPWAEEDPILSLKDFGKGCEVYLYDRNTQEHSNVNCQMDDVIIQQYTGLKDKNGVEIYEGDIVSMTSRQVEIKGVVEYQPPCFIVVKDVAEYNLYNYDSIEVVGNIFEGIDK